MNFLYGVRPLYSRAIGVEPMKKTVEQWFIEKGTKRVMPVESVRLAWAEHGNTWPIGFEVTEFEYDAAVHHILTTPIGYRADGVKTGGRHK